MRFVVNKPPNEKNFSVNYRMLIKKPSHSSPKSKYDYLIKNIYDDCIVKNPLILTSIQKREYGRYFSLLTIVGL